MEVLAHVLLEGTSPIVTAMVAAAVLFFRDARAVLLTIGALLARSVVLFLKRLIKQPRPDPKTHKKSEGFPSSHATLLSFLSFMVSTRQWGLSPVAVVLVWIVCAVLVGVRVLHAYHSTIQVLAGVFLGCCLAFLWQWLVVAYLLAPTDALLKQMLDSAWNFTQGKRFM
jgi:membrane-associated phospholipid phosphatase